MLKHIPNTLTFARIAAAPLMAVCVLFLGTSGAWFAALLFLAASITDFVDGYLARRFNVQSRIGAIMDPVADKVVVVTALLLLIWNGTIDHWHVIAVLVILWRDLIVSGFREAAALEERPITVSSAGKIKTATQMVAIFVLLSAPAAGGVPAEIVGLTLLWLAAGLTAYSGYEYVRGLIAPKGAA